MKTPSSPTLTHRSHLTWFIIMFLAIVVSGCDTLEPDSLGDQPKIEIKDEPVVFSAGTPGLIDLNSLVESSSGEHTFSVTQPRLGTLEPVSEFLLKYTPNEGVTEGEDAFVLSVYDSDHIIVDQDSIFIIIVSDSIDLPCNWMAYTDYAMVSPDSLTPVVIDVLANDSLCGLDPSELIVTILEVTVGDSITPMFGKAEVLADGKILYTPSTSFSGFDSFYYHVTKAAAADSLQFATGTVFINSSTCHAPIAEADTLLINFNDIVVIDSITFDTTVFAGPHYIKALANDTWCAESSFRSVTVALDSEGITEVSLDESGFKYTLPENIYWGYQDYFRYRICDDYGCAETEIWIIVQ